MVTQDPSRKLAVEKDRPIRILQVRKNTVTVDLNGIHKTVSIDRTTLASTAKEATSAAEEERQENVQNNKTSTNSDEDVVEQIVR